jgi:hypothetical protein
MTEPRDRTTEAGVIRGRFEGSNLEKSLPKFRKVRDVLEVLSFIAVILAAPGVYFELRDTRQAQERQEMVNRLMLTDTWIQKLQSIMPQLGETEAYLSDGSIPNQVKIDRINNEATFRDKVNNSLSHFEEMALLYNLGVLHKERIWRGVGSAIVGYWDAAEFWVKHCQKANPRLYRELVIMVEDIRKHTKEP